MSHLFFCYIFLLIKGADKLFPLFDQEITIS